MMYLSYLESSIFPRSLKLPRPWKNQVRLSLVVEVASTKVNQPWLQGRNTCSPPGFAIYPARKAGWQQINLIPGL